MRRIGAIAFVVLINALLTFGLLEVAGLALYWSEAGQLFYRRAVVTERQTISRPFETNDFRPILHPYFGYLYATRFGERRFQAYYINNHFFVQERGYADRHPGCCDFPYVKRPGEFVIGIFGGSVASATAVVAQLDDYLPQLLSKHLAFSSKTIRVLSFAVGGHKQPQQLEILSYYLSLNQNFDAVINIDGYNEINAGQTNAGLHFTLSYPNAHIWSTIPRFLDGQAAAPNSASLIAAYHQLAARESLDAVAQCSVAICYLWRKSESLWHGMLSKTTNASAAASYFAVEPAREGDWLEAIADQWSRSVVLMHAQLSALGIPFVEIIQPNIWFRPIPYTGKPRHPNADTLAKGYPILLARVPFLKEQGVNVIDATAMFNDRDDVYSDDCCHFTNEGNQAIVRLVADWLVKSAKE